ncbi:hypothetical protein D7Y56_23535 [Streptomyces sp. S501]|nr:hypothetical protein D7Y56_23535 [Streptomyces sp. S501]
MPLQPGDAVNRLCFLQDRHDLPHAARRAPYERTWPRAAVTPLDARTIFAGGGGIHRITQQQPRI